MQPMLKFNPNADPHTDTGYWGATTTMNTKRLFRVGVANGQIVARRSQPIRKLRLRVVMPVALAVAFALVEVWRWVI